jgi:K+-transporting ATPase ATPase B chain
VISWNHKILGVIDLKDIIKQGVQEKFADPRKMGIKAIMITGNNPMTAAAITAEAGGMIFWRKPHRRQNCK